LNQSFNLLLEYKASAIINSATFTTVFVFTTATEKLVVAPLETARDQVSHWNLMLQTLFISLTSFLGFIPTLSLTHPLSLASLLSLSILSLHTCFDSSCSFQYHFHSYPGWDLSLKFWILLLFVAPSQVDPELFFH
jgi:CHASE2 domain-containing sensor protein